MSRDHPQNPPLALPGSSERGIHGTGEGESCRVAEAHPKVKAYVKNHNLGFEVPYRYGSLIRR